MIGHLHRVSLLLLALLLAPCASAAVSDADSAGFTVSIDSRIAASRSDVYTTFVDDVGRWWSGDLTVSGLAETLFIDARPMGCFCEALASGGIVHMTVTLVDTNNMLRLTGGLGPLGLMGVAGNMTIEFSDADDATAVKLTYAVGGYHPDGLDTLAPQVDAVLKTQLDRLRRYVESGDPDSGN